MIPFNIRHLSFRCRGFYFYLKASVYYDYCFSGLIADVSSTYNFCDAFSPAVHQILFHNMAKCYKEAGSLEYLCSAFSDFPYGFTDVDLNPALYFA
jgi:hypothetical protein